MIPKTKFDDISEDARRLLQANHRPDQFSVERIKRQARTLKAADAVGSYEILAQCAAIEGDAEEIERCYQSALNAPRYWDEYSLLRFANAFGEAGCYGRARELMLEALKVHEHSPSIIADIANMLGRIGYFAEAAGLREDDTVSPKALQLIVSEGFDPSEVTAATQLVLDTLRREYVRPSEIVTWIGNDLGEYARAVVMEVIVDVPVETASALETAVFTELYTAAIPLEQSGKLVFVINPEKTLARTA